MNTRLVILRTAVLVFLLGVQTPQFAQDTSTGPTMSDLIDLPCCNRPR